MSLCASPCTTCTEMEGKGQGLYSLRLNEVNVTRTNAVHVSPTLDLITRKERMTQLNYALQIYSRKYCKHFNILGKYILQ